MPERSQAHQTPQATDDQGWEYDAEHAWLARSTIECFACSRETTVFGFYVNGASEREVGHSEEPRTVDGFLHYVTQLDRETEIFIIRNQARLWPDDSRTFGARYWMNHCEHCGAAQGDHYVFSTPGQGFFPTDDAGIAALRYERLPHALHAAGSIGEVSFGPASGEAS